MKRTPLKRGTSQLKRSPLKKVNTERKAKRDKNKRKHYASPEYKAARKEQVKVSGGQCEAVHVFDQNYRLAAVLLPEESIPLPEGVTGGAVIRCLMHAHLEFHELNYGSDIGLIRAIKGVMLCPSDHQYIEVTRHPHRQRNR